MLDKTYRPDEVEKEIYTQWEKSGVFACKPGSNANPFTIVIPPPNVTGSLHMGHALNFTIQDILVRFHRMRGDDALWQPGTDHAGIATQMVVERQLAAQGKTRHDLGRDKFIDRVWEWKAESGGTITRQMRRLGTSVDWARERFTMDDGLSAAVRKVFVTLYKQGLIYKDKRLVNWDPILHTAISDLEVEQREVKGKMWYFRYPLEGTSDRFIVVGTTRPETMLGDTAVAVHPDDDRYKELVGKNCVLPIVNRPIPIVADEYANPEKGNRRRQDHPGPRFQRLRGGTAARPRDDQRPRRRRAPQRERARAFPRDERPGRPREDRRRDGRTRPPREDRGQPDDDALRRPHRGGDRAVADRPVVRRRQDAGPSRPSRRSSRAAPSSCPSTGRTPTSNGCATSSRGAFPARSGGAIRFPPGTARTTPSSSNRPRRRPRRRPRSTTARRSSCGATATCWTPGSRRPCGRSRPWVGRRIRPRSSATIRPTSWSPASTSSSSGSPA